MENDLGHFELSNSGDGCRAKFSVLSTFLLQYHSVVFVRIILKVSMYYNCHLIVYLATINRLQKCRHIMVRNKSCFELAAVCPGCLSRWFKDLLLFSRFLNNFLILLEICIVYKECVRPYVFDCNVYDCCLEIELYTIIAKVHLTFIHNSLRRPVQETQFVLQ